MSPRSTDPVVRTETGLVRGFWRISPPKNRASAAFLGIPFAQAPVGDLRYAAPVLPQPWEGLLDATQYGATAQRGDPGITLIPEPSIAGDSVLNVNVFTPEPAELDDPLPVMVWIHGGGYISGSPASPWYDGRTFNRGDVVTVTISYRLGFEGFGHIPGAPSNRGVRDWLAALEWVRRNIYAFGGDPSQVTIAGQSAGGGAVLTLLAMPAAQHLFRGAWALSGALADIPHPRAAALSVQLAERLGVEYSLSGFSAVTEQQIIDLQQKAAVSEENDDLSAIKSVLSSGPAIGPTVDGELLREPSLESLRKGIGADKPLVLGSTDDEFTMATDHVRSKLRFVPPSIALSKLVNGRTQRRAYLADNRAQRRLGTAAVVGRYIGDAIFRSTVVRTAQARGSAPTWVYRFSWASPTRRWALHCVDVPFWFNCLNEPHVADIAGDKPPQSLADEVHGAALKMIREGRPGWKPWSESSGTTRIFGGAVSGPDVVPDGYHSVRALV